MLMCSYFRDIVFGPPGRSKAPILFLFANLFLWGYPVYFFSVSTITVTGTSAVRFHKEGYPM